MSVRRKIHATRTAGLRKFQRRDPLIYSSAYWLRARLFMHGNLWCALYGETVPSGIAGFGHTPAEAFDDFDTRELPALVIAELRRQRCARWPVKAWAASPSWFLQPKLQRDGNCFWFLYGRNAQDGVAGFGPTLEDARAAFDLNWFTHIGPLANLGTRIIL